MAGNRDKQLQKGDYESANSEKNALLSLGIQQWVLTRHTL